MYLKKIDRWHKGFSLIELLIVILIISLVYFLGFNGFEKPQNRLKALTPLNLKSNILKTISPPATLLCINKCRSCYLRNGINSTFEPYESPIDLKDTEAYTLDHSNSLIKLEYGRYQDNQVCLVYNLYRNGSSTQLILKNKKGVYFLPAFFGEAKKVASLEEAKALWLKNNDLVSNSGDFY